MKAGLFQYWKLAWICDSPRELSYKLAKSGKYSRTPVVRSSRALHIHNKRYERKLWIFNSREQTICLCVRCTCADLFTLLSHSWVTQIFAGCFRRQHVILRKRAVFRVDSFRRCAAESLWAASKIHGVFLLMGKWRRRKEIPRRLLIDGWTDKRKQVDKRRREAQ